MDFLVSIRDFLVDYGLWTVILLAATKWVTGVLAAVQEGTFKWHKIGDTLREGDFVKVAVVGILSIINYDKLFGADNVNDGNVVAPLLAALTVDLTAGIIRNLGRIFPNLGQTLPQSLK